MGSDVEARCRREIVELHDFFAAWFSADPMPLAAAIGRLAAPLLEWYDDELAAQLESVESIFRSELAFKET